ncbi:MAG: hypothetical protein DRQ41_15210 [Gammaproteobacteria bacterium]|nr:MAG: hypothetical protein DRQ41_15210 [Gammaproteobacteria bacterium]
MSGRYKNKLYRVERSLDSCPPSGILMAICKPTMGGNSKLPLILIYRSYPVEESELELENDWLSSESEIEDYLLSERKRKEIQRKLYSKYSSNTDRPANITIKEANYSYDQSVHAAFEELQGQMNGTDILRATATILGSRTKTTLFCQSENTKIVDPVKLIREIADSFEYDAGYEFGAPNPDRMDSHERMKKKAKGSLIQFCVISFVLLVGLFFFRFASGEYIPIVALVVASVSGQLVFMIAPWLVWQVGFMAGYEWHNYVPFIAAIVVMVSIIWKWPGSEISFLKSIVGVGSLFFLASSMVFTLMAVANVAVANGGVIYLLFFVVQSAFVIFIWRCDF